MVPSRSSGWMARWIRIGLFSGGQIFLQMGQADGRPFVRQPGAGRPRLDFPDGWTELYDKWEKESISSKAFLEASGLKKATFYNKLADYRELREFNIRYLLEHGIA